MLRNCSTCSNLCLRTSRMFCYDDDGNKEILFKHLGCKKGSVPHIGTPSSNECRDWEEIQ